MVLFPFHVLEMLSFIIKGIIIHQGIDGVSFKFNVFSYSEFPTLQNASNLQLPEGENQSQKSIQ